MTDSPHRPVLAGRNSLSIQGITEADVLITGMLVNRPARQPDFKAQSQALDTLAQHWIDEPQSLLKRLVHLALDLCQADTVGVSLLETIPTGEPVFRWVAIAGALEALEQNTTPGSFSPCSTTLVCNQPQLYSYPERFFTYLQHPQFPIVEGLLIPLCINDRPLGTLWIISHREDRCFDAEDQRLMFSLGGFAAAAFHRLHQLALRQREQFNQQVFDSSDDCVKVLDLEGRILFMNQRGQTLLDISDITPFLNTVWAEFWQGTDQQAAIVAVAKAKAGEVQTFQGYCPTLNGKPKWWDVKVSPILGEQGQVERLLCISRDITEHKRREANAAFLAEISEAFSRLATVDEIMQMTCAKTAAYFDLSRCLLVKISTAMNEAKVVYDFGANDLPSLVGTYRIAEFHTEDEVQELAAGRAIVIHDVAVPRAAAAADRFARLRIGSLVNASYVSSGQWKFALSAMQMQPRVWCIDEVELLQELAARVCLRIERAQAEAALRESEADYRSLFQSIDEGFCIVEMIFDAQEKPVDYRFVQANPAFVKLTGLPQAALGKTARELVPDLEAFWFEMYGKVALTGEAVRFENKSKSLNRWFDVHASRVGDAASRRVAIVFNNITDRKQAERQMKFLSELSRKLGTVTDVAEINRIVTREVGMFLNGHRCYYLEVMPDDSHVTVLPDWRRDGLDLAGTYNLAHFGAKEWWETAARQPFGIDDVNVHPWTKDFADNYTRINLQSYVIAPFVREGRWVASIGVSSDKPRHWTADEILLLENVAARVAPLIERACAEAIVAADLQDTQRLRELGMRLVIEDDTHTLYREVLLAAIALTEADAGTVQIFDPATQDLVLIVTQGFEQTMLDHFHRVNASSNTPCGIALKHGDRSFVDFDLPQREDPDGSMRMHLEAGYRSGQSTPLLTRTGKPIGMVSTHWHQPHRPSDRQLRFLDLLARQAADLIEQRQTATEREQLLAREQAARAEADRANRIKDEFLAVLSHELRSPLNPILGWAKLLQTGKLDAARTQQALQTIERNAHLQSELIEDLLDVSRILQGKINLNVSSVNLVFIIQAAIETVRLAAEAKSITLETNFESDISWVSGDSTRLQQVIWNLLSNAVKFTPAGGQVEIRLQAGAKGVDENLSTHSPIHPSTHLPIHSYAQITVTDTGQGIAPDFLPYVFDYFRQADATTTRKFGGLGLGLAIVRHLVELHGGTVAVESLGVGRGATFTVQLPLMPNQTIAYQHQRSSESSASLNGIQVLVVDDEPDSREFVAFVLRQAGATVVTATTADEALTLLRQAKPTVLLSDIGMPEMDGYMLMQQVKALPPEQGGQVQAIALTAYAGDFNQQRALQAGFQKHLSKPIEPEKLIQVVFSLIQT